MCTNETTIVRGRVGGLLFFLFRMIRFCRAYTIDKFDKFSLEAFFYLSHFINDPRHEALWILWVLPDIAEHFMCGVSFGICGVQNEMKGKRKSQFAYIDLLYADVWYSSDIIFVYRVFITFYYQISDNFTRLVYKLAGSFSFSVSKFSWH